MNNDDEVEEMVKKMDPYEKIILYGAGSPDSPLKTKVKLQKLMFLCSKALPDIIGTDLSFEAHKKGPYSEDVEEILNSIEDKKLISIPGLNLTPLGKRALQYIHPKEPIKSVVDEYRLFLSSLSEDELLTLVYVTYPEYQIHSEEWGRLQHLRKKVAGSMLKKECISFSKAAEIAGISPDLFVDYLDQNNIRWRRVN